MDERLNNEEKANLAVLSAKVAEAVEPAIKDAVTANAHLWVQEESGTVVTWGVMAALCLVAAEMLQSLHFIEDPVWREEMLDGWRKMLARALLPGADAGALLH